MKTPTQDQHKIPIGRQQLIKNTYLELNGNSGYKPENQFLFNQYTVIQYSCRLDLCYITIQLCFFFKQKSQKKGKSAQQSAIMKLYPPLPHSIILGKSLVEMLLARVALELQEIYALDECDVIWTQCKSRFIHTIQKMRLTFSFEKKM